MVSPSELSCTLNINHFLVHWPPRCKGSHTNGRHTLGNLESGWSLDFSRRRQVLFFMDTINTEHAHSVLKWIVQTNIMRMNKRCHIAGNYGKVCFCPCRCFLNLGYEVCMKEILYNWWRLKESTQSPVPHYVNPVKHKQRFHPSFLQATNRCTPGKGFLRNSLTKGNYV